MYHTCLHWLNILSFGVNNLDLALSRATLIRVGRRGVFSSHIFSHLSYGSSGLLKLGVFLGENYNTLDLQKNYLGPLFVLVGFRYFIISYQGGPNLLEDV